MPRNPFSEFEEVPDEVAKQLESHNRVNGLLSTVQNLFGEFAQEDDKQLPMDKILASHDSAMERLTNAYGQLVAECLGDALWQADRQTIEKTYAVAWQMVNEMEWELTDVEAFCTYALQSGDSAFFVMDPLGLFLSAFCNASSLSEIHLDLSGEDLKLSLLGYQLREGLTLTLVGDFGDLIGISLNGGHLIINGNVRHYLGAGMIAGQIDVSDNAGRFIGEQMQGGEIHIDGRLGGVGNPQGGTIYHRQQVIYGKK